MSRQDTAMASSSSHLGNCECVGGGLDMCMKMH